MPLSRAFCALLFVAIGLQAAIAAERGIAIEWDPRDSAEGPGAIWLGYLMARAAYRDKQKIPIPASGEIIPSFAEEVSARSSAATIYKELKEKDKKLHDAYFEQLAMVEGKGFMPAYVWTFLRRSAWPESEAPRNLDAFERWRASALKNHKAQTHGRLSVSSK